MKKLIFIFAMLICAASLNAQDTISKKIITAKEYNPATGEWVNTKAKIEYTIKVDPSYVQGEYLQRAGRNFTNAAVLFSTSLACGIVTAFIPVVYDKNGADINKSARYGAMAITGGVFIGSVVCFFMGSNNMTKAGIVITQNRKCIITTDGTKIKINF